MAISHLFSGNPINGTAEDDFIFGSALASAAANTLNGNGGDDLIIGDISNWWTVFAGISNSTTATAVDIDNSAFWFRKRMRWSAIPHSSRTPPCSPKALPERWNCTGSPRSPVR